MTYLDPAIVNDEGTVAEAALTGIADRIDGWQPAEGHVETSLSEAVAVAIATAVTALKDTAKDSYRGFGTRILGILPIAATVATTTATITLTADAVANGLELDAGAEIDAIRPDGTPVVLVTTVALDIPPGMETWLGVQLAAVEAGADSNGAAGAATSGIAGIETITLDAPTSGGQDAEDPDDYADRLTERARRLRFLPITVSDYAAAALDVAGVGRSAPINRYDPANPGVDSPGHLTLINLQDTGALLTPAITTALNAYLTAAERPLSVQLHLADPVFVDATIAVTIRLAAIGVDDQGQPVIADPDATTQTVSDAITSLLDPAVFDADSSAPGGWARGPSTQLTVFDIARAIDDLPGVGAVTEITINGTDHLDLPAPLSMPNLIAAPTITIA